METSPSAGQESSGALIKLVPVTGSSLDSTQEKPLCFAPRDNARGRRVDRAQLLGWAGQTGNVALPGIVAADYIAQFHAGHELNIGPPFHHF